MTKSSPAEQVGLFGKWGPPFKKVLHTYTQLVLRQASAGLCIQMSGSRGHHRRRGLCSVSSDAFHKGLELVWEVVQQG